MIEKKVQASCNFCYVAQDIVPNPKEDETAYVCHNCGRMNHHRHDLQAWKQLNFWTGFILYGLIAFLVSAFLCLIWLKLKGVLP